MANIKSAIKRAKTSSKKNLRNRLIKSNLKTTIKKFNQAVIAADKAVVDEAYLKAVSTVDKAAAKGVIHKNAANRKKAQLAGQVSAMAK